MVAEPMSAQPRYTPAIEVVDRGDTYARVIGGRRVLVVVDERGPLAPVRTFADRWPGARS